MNNIGLSVRIEQPGAAPVQITLTQLPTTHQVITHQETKPARFEALDGDLRPCAVGDHAYVRDNSTGLVWTAQNVTKKSAPWAEADSACKALGEGWRLPTRSELLTLVDDTRHGPCIDTTFFRTVKNDWYWTGTPAAWSAECAWVVHFLSGNANGGHRDLDAFVRAVRAAPAGQ